MEAIKANIQYKFGTRDLEITVVGQYHPGHVPYPGAIWEEATIEIEKITIDSEEMGTTRLPFSMFSRKDMDGFKLALMKHVQEPDEDDAEGIYAGSAETDPQFEYQTA